MATGRKSMQLKGITRLAPHLIALSAAALIGLWLREPQPQTDRGWGPLIGADESSTPSEPRRSAPAPASRPAASDAVMRGVAVQVDSNYKPIERFGQLIREVAALGADTVLLSVNAYQQRIDSGLIEIDPERTPTDAQWLELFDIARRAGLRIIYMPKILLKDTAGGKWRGQIAPPSWESWFNQYRRYVVGRAKLAEQGGAEVFIVGSELISAEKFTDEWRQTIDAVREVYTGKLTYSSNWDHYTSIQFWDDLDLVGMTSYYNLNRAGHERPSADQLATAWKPIQKTILEWQADIDRPLLFTEVGWCSQQGCSSQPWNYYLRDEASPEGLDEQAANYEAFIRTWSDVPEVGGVIWWEWTPAEGGPDDHHYTPKGKPAEQRLRDFFRAAQRDAHR